MALRAFVCQALIQTFLASDCNRIDSKYDYNFYSNLSIPVIKLDDNQLRNALLFDQSMKEYGLAIIDPGDNVSMQQYFDITYAEVKQFFDTGSSEYKMKFAAKHSPIGYFPFGHEKFGMKRKMLPDVLQDIMRKDANYIDSNQTLEPLESFYIFNKYQKLIYNDHAISNILGNTIHQNIPKEFYYQSLRVFYEFHLIFIEIMKLASISLGLNKYYLLNHDNYLYNGYTHSLKFAHYLRFGDQLNICDYPYRYDAHHDVGIITLQRLMDVQAGFQIFVNKTWYNMNIENVNGGISTNSMIVINGKHMEYWTNGYWKACIHRVLSDKKARLPFLYFTQADENTEIYPISQCAVCVSNGSNIEYQHVFGRSTHQFVREWQSKNP